MAAVNNVPQLLDKKGETEKCQSYSDPLPSKHLWKNFDDEVDERSSEEYLRDYKAGYKKIKTKLALFEASPFTSQNPKAFQPNNKGLVAETFDWDEEEVSDDDEVTQVKRLMALADDELTVGKNHASNGEWIDITMRKTELSKSVDSSKVSQDFKLKVQNSGSSKSLRPKPIQKPQIKCELCHYTNYFTDDCYKILYYMICKKEDHRTSDHEMYTASLKRSEKYKDQPYQYASPSKQILKAKEKPFPPCTRCGFNDHRLDDCKNYPECGINHVLEVIDPNEPDMPLTKDTEDRANHKILIEEDTTRIMTELILKEHMEKAQAESSLAKPNTDDDMNIEPSKEFFMELRSNAYYRMFDEDVVDHIAKVLEILDLMKIPNVDTHQLRMKVFLLSLADDARQWWIEEGEGKITTWEELVEKFFYKFYPLSCDGEYEMLYESDNKGLDPLEFISRVNSIFKNHRRVDERTKKHYWIHGQIEVGIKNR
nr:retrovirus-related Pol polyprotein from transposon TNT 1-94 [Tanacetum cinerariifolium]